MIIFELSCGSGHRFEGWFGSADDFVRQQEAQLVQCPICNDAHITKVPSARVRTGKAHEPAPPAVPAAPGAPAAATPSAPPVADAIAGISAEVLHKLREIVRGTENVGRRFPEEARKIHYEEVPARAIRGQASREEAESLRDEGIEFSPLPPFLTEETQ